MPPEKRDPVLRAIRTNTLGVVVVVLIPVLIIISAILVRIYETTH